MKKFNTPEINSVELNAVEALMTSRLVEPGVNDAGEKKINYSIADADRNAANMQKYWSGK